MLRTAIARSWLTGLAAALAAAALSGCQGGPDLPDAPGRVPLAATRRTAEADGGRDGERARAEDGRDGDGAQDGDGEERRADADPPTVEGDAALVPYLVRSEAADLEFSDGLPEPPQGKVVPAPAPWMPPSGADADAKPVIEDVWPDKGPVTGGERITIRGKNLQAAQVVFGLVPARILAVSESQDTLVVAAPAAQAGPVAIVVTNLDGNYALSSATFHYYD